MVRIAARNQIFPLVALVGLLFGLLSPLCAAGDWTFNGPSGSGHLLNAASKSDFAPTIPDPGELTMRSCDAIYSRWCYYDTEGRVVFWAEEHEIKFPQGKDFWGNRKDNISKRVVFTGGYAEIRRKQEEYNEWLKSDPSRPLSSIEGDLDSLLRAALGSTNGQIPADGALNLRTLATPYLQSDRIIRRMWERFQSECGCATLGVDDYQHFREAGKTLQIPDQILAFRAEIIRSAWIQRLSLGEELGILIPLTRWDLERRNHGQRNNLDLYFPRHFGKDHFEPNELPSGFIQTLLKKERALWKAIEDAAHFERFEK